MREREKKREKEGRRDIKERNREKKREKERKREKRCPGSIIILNFFSKSICQHLISIIINLPSIHKKTN